VQFRILNYFYILNYVIQNIELWNSKYCVIKNKKNVFRIVQFGIQFFFCLDSEGLVRWWHWTWKCCGSGTGREETTTVALEVGSCAVVEFGGGVCCDWEVEERCSMKKMVKFSFRFIYGSARRFAPNKVHYHMKIRGSLKYYVFVWMLVKKTV